MLKDFPHFDAFEINQQNVYEQFQLLAYLKTPQLKPNNNSYFGDFEIVESRNEWIHLTV